MKAKNRIISGYLKGFTFSKRRDKLYLLCLERKLIIDNQTIRSLKVLSKNEYPNLLNTLFRGYLLSKLFGLLGLLAGTSTSVKHVIYKVRIVFFNNEVSIAEINQKVFDYLLIQLADYIE